ncbi:hypothetical protein GH769_14790 [Pseudomonas sp. CFSAN084952]|uniref:hypothetical protein n=1 Tax=Pseudomonas TaxID=286 RepID=UPI001299C148|nr:hypothetical protein [Pseudomonas sp. CFSAN084952]QGF94461.1 hypothetical protein GH769_14790 [Pseudomonas sp. CFSAN084952]
MRQEGDQAKFGEVICKRNTSDGKPAWILTEDGSIFISEQAVKDATIQSAKIIQKC